MPLHIAYERLTTTVGRYLLYVQESGVTSAAAAQAFVDVEQAWAEVQRAYQLGEELLASTERPRLFVLPGIAPATSPVSSRDTGPAAA